MSSRKLSPSTAKLAVTAKWTGPVHLKAKIATALKQFARLRDSNKENALRGLFLGGLLWQIKEEAGHGNFLRLATERLADIPKTTRNELMRLWLVFRDQAQLDAAKLTIPDPQRALAKSGAAQEAVVKAALAFVGELSLHALMVEHDVREQPKLGGRRQGGAGGAGTKPQDAEQLYLFSRDEIGAVITHAEKLLLKENKLQHLAGHPEEIAGVVKGLRDLADQVEAAAKPLLKGKS
jgi:hypothetical protein